MDILQITILLLLIKTIDSFYSCGYPSYPLHATISLSTDTISDGTVVTYTCDIGYELLGPSRRTCNGHQWLPSTIPFCVVPREEQQDIHNNVIQYKSESTPAFDGQIVEEVSVPDISESEDAEDRSDPLDTNKFSLNVIDVSPHDTQLAHSVLIVHKPKPNNKTKSKNKPSLLIPQTISHTIVSGTIMTAVKPKTTPMPITTTSEVPVVVRGNHKPLFLRPFPGRKKPSTTSTTTTTTTTTTVPTTTSAATTTTTSTPPPTTTTTQSSSLSFKFTPSTTSIHSATASTYSQTMNISFATTDTEESDDYPVVFNSNHKKQGFTRQKLTSTEYALIFTTPESATDNDKIGFSEVPTATASSYTFRPPYVTTLNHMKRPPMKIMTVNANKVKQPDEIYSEGITVLDPPFVSGHTHKLPPNTTIIHKNLIVPMKEGRPKPVFPMTSTTQYPIYPVVAGITKWHTNPTTPWAVPLVTTTSPDQMIVPNTVGSTQTDSDLSFGQSVTHPTVLTSGEPLVSSSTPHTTHLVTVTPVKSTHGMLPSSSNTFVVTHSSPSPSPSTRPSTTTANYVNAIWAPPMPIARPVQSQPVSSSWYSPIANIFSYDPSSSSMLSFMGIFRTLLYAMLVFALPPLTLALALLQVAVG